MDGPFREMPDVLGAAEREEAAIGGRVAQAILRRRTPTHVTHLAEKWQIAEAELARVAAVASA
jgi:hypothetical protein